MSIADSFLKALRTIGFPQINAFKASDFETLILNSDLQPLFESISGLSEESVLTPEEIAEYEELSSSEISYFEKLAEDENFLATDASEAENREEFLYLEEYLSLVEEEKKSLQSQKDMLKLHENHLLKTKANLEKDLVDAQKQFELYSWMIAPQTVFKLSSDLKLVMNSISELQALIQGSEGESKLLNGSVYQDLEIYFDFERKVLDLVKDFFKQHIEVCYDKDSNPSLKVSGFVESKLLKEVHHLKNVFKKCKVEEYLAKSEKLKMEAMVKFLQTNEENHLKQLFGISTSQLRSKIVEEERLNEQLREKENIAMQNLISALSEHINCWCSLIGESFSQEIIEIFEKNYENIQIPLEAMLSQRSRLELISLYLDSFRKSFESVKNLVDSTFSFVQKEQAITAKMKDLHEEKKIEQCAISGSTQENLILSTVDELLSDCDDQLIKSSNEDILKKIKKIFEDQHNLEKLQEDKLNHLHLLEGQRSDLKKFAYKGKPISDLLEAEANFNVRFNQQNLRMTTLVNSISETETFVHEKEKLLERSRNLQLCRELFKDAVLDPAEFEKHIEKIKVAYEIELDH